MLPVRLARLSAAGPWYCQVHTGNSMLSSAVSCAPLVSLLVPATASAFSDACCLSLCAEGGRWALAWVPAVSDD